MFSVSDAALLIALASIPLANKDSTWSFISESKGDTTIVTPFITRAGNW